ncbi:MAG: serine hydrolase [Rhodanobacteraceae bacterium]
MRQGSPAEAGLVPQALDEIDGTVSRALARRATPGAVVLVARRGVIAKWKAYGYALLYKDGKYTLAAHPRPMQKNEIFDLASISKLFTAVAVMQLWDEGKFKLDDPVARYLPKFGVHGKENVTIRELLTHTSGLVPSPSTPIPLYKVPGSRKDRMDYVLQLPIDHPPGTHYVYSNLNFEVLGALINRLSGEREDVFIRKHLTGPLHMTDTMFDPPKTLDSRIAATEYQPWTHRGMLVGGVDDEDAFALDGVAGDAGVFSTAHDLAIFGQMMLNDGTYDGVRVLSKQAVKLLLTNWTQKFGTAIGLGWSIDQAWYQGALAGPDTAGHEGYTGTALTVDRKNNLVTVILTNREHPTRNGPPIDTLLHGFNTDVANAIPVAAPGGGSAWFSGYGNHLNRKLTVKVKSQHDSTLSFQTWYRLQPDDDYGSVEASSDDVHWKVLSLLTGPSHGWQTKKVSLPADARYVQFRYRTDAGINGRGWYVNHIQVHADGATAQPKIIHNQWNERDY